MKNSSFKQQVYENPRMSLKLICEYVNASPSRRNTIIKDSCIVPTFIAKRYNLASDTIAEYVSKQQEDLNTIFDKIRAIRSASYLTSNERSMAYLSAEALLAFTRKASEISHLFDQFKMELTNHLNYYKMNIEGVEISIRPEIVLRSRETNDIIGFVKLQFSKTSPLDIDTADLITCLGRNYFNETHSLNLAEKYCFVLDVFNGQIYTAPRSFKKRMSDVIASCREIADRWYKFK